MHKATNGSLYYQFEFMIRVRCVWVHSKMIYYLVIMCVLSKRLVDSTDSFAPTLYKQIVHNEQNNFVVSPYSAETALARVLLGTRGETAEELRQVVSTQDVSQNLHGNDLYTLNSANKIYVQENFMIKDEFKRQVSAEVANIDFMKNVEAAKTINSWVQEESNNKIQNIIDSNDLDNNTRTVLFNALYFKANWTTPFQLSNSGKFDFYRTPNDVVKADAMTENYRQRFLYFECSHLNAKFLELPFKGGEASMTLVLPNDKTGLANLENQIERVFERHNLTTERVIVQIPKFKIETKVDLKKILENLGVKKLFNETKADLSGIAGEKGDLVVNKVVQKSFIEVNEEGVEAAAATFVLIGIPSSAILGPPPKKFIADHPFIFYIKVKEIIVFAGKVTDPTL